MKELESYLNDHLAGSVSALELLDHYSQMYKGKPLGLFFSEMYAEIRADQTTLRDVMHSLGIKESNLRKAGAWVAEKAGQTRLMIAGDEPRGLGLVLTLEGLIMGVTGKRMVWRTLAAAKLPEMNRYDFEQLEHRAEQQIEGIEVERIRTVQHAFARTPASQ
jgi:hypothetical protein